MKKKELEKIIRDAYRAGQDSVSCMKVTHAGMAKPGCMCDNNPCTCTISETSTAEDDVVKKLLP